MASTTNPTSNGLSYEKLWREFVSLQSGDVRKLCAVAEENESLRAQLLAAHGAQRMAEAETARAMAAHAIDVRDRGLPDETSGLNDARLLRRMLAFAYSGPGELYGDDGELQNGAELPVIDFNRDSVSEIERKITERGRRRLAKMQQEEPAAIETIAARIENLTRALRAKQAKIDALMLEFCPGEAPAEISTLSVGVQQALDFIGWKCDGESHADVADNLDIFDAASALRSAILRLQAQLRMVGHQRDEYAALLREARTNLHVPDLVARIERSVDCSSVEPRETSTVTTPLEQLLVEWWSTDMDNAELFNRAVRLSPALAAAMNALPEKAE